MSVFCLFSMHFNYFPISTYQIYRVLCAKRCCFFALVEAGKLEMQICCIGLRRSKVTRDLNSCSQTYESCETGTPARDEASAALVSKVTNYMTPVGRCSWAMEQ